jgi:hypothetical protein
MREKVARELHFNAYFVAPGALIQELSPSPRGSQASAKLGDYENISIASIRICLGQLDGA